MSEPKMGRTQMKIMQVLWDKKRATAQEITNTINETEEVSHSTVQTFLRILVKNKAVDFDRDNRTFVYYPLLKSNNVRFKAVRDFVDTLFPGSPGGVISYIIDNMDVPDDQLDQIKSMIDAKKKDGNA